MDHRLKQRTVANSDDTAGDSDDPAPRSSDEPDSRDSEMTPGDDEADASSRVTVAWEVADCDPPVEPWLTDRLHAALDHLGLDQTHLNILIVDDAVMSQYHLDYCDIPGTTDVLTFDLRDPSENDAQPIGDLLLCIDEAKRQAAERGHATREELLLYAVHGLMHLLGEDDHDEQAYAAMHAREDALLEAIGVGRLFTPHDRASRDAMSTGVSRAVP